MPDLTPLEDTLGPEPEIVSSEVVFSGHVWDVRQETFRYGDGELTREFVDHTGAVAIFALDDEDRVLLIRQYRFPVRMTEWEIPAGLLDIVGEDPLLAAKRELAEEADLEADVWHTLAEFATSPGGNNEMLRIYLARGVRATAEAFDRHDEEADIETRWVPLDELREAVLATRVQNPSLVIGTHAAYALRERGWDGLLPEDAPWPRHPVNRR